MYKRQVLCCGGRVNPTSSLHTVKYSVSLWQVVDGTANAWDMSVITFFFYTSRFRHIYYFMTPIAFTVCHQWFLHVNFYICHCLFCLDVQPRYTAFHFLEYVKWWDFSYNRVPVICNSRQIMWINFLKKLYWDARRQMEWFNVLPLENNNYLTKKIISLKLIKQIFFIFFEWNSNKEIIFKQHCYLQYFDNLGNKVSC